jgi:hypothetical protein
MVDLEARTVADVLPERNKMAPTTASPSAYHSYLSWLRG